MTKRELQELERAEERKKRKKKAQMQSYMVAGGSLVFVIAIIVVAIIFISGLFEKKNGKGNLDKGQQVENNSVDENMDEAHDIEPQGETSDDENIADENNENEEIDNEEKLAQILDDYIKPFIDEMSVEEKVAALFFVSPESITGVRNAVMAGSSTNEAMNEYPIGGLLYDSGNMQDAEQFRNMISNTKSFSKHLLFIGVEDEGGPQSPFAKSRMREDEILSQQEIGQSDDLSGSYSANFSMAGEMKEYGINTNFGPVIDISLEDNSFISSRSYGSDPAAVSALVQGAVKGMHDQSINVCAKYFPMHGDLTKETEQDRSVSERTKEDLKNTDIPILRALIREGTEMIMVSHVSMPQIIGDNAPASLSEAIVTDILRKDLEYDGIIITDYMNKAAITKYYKHADASVMAIQAGADMIMMPGDFKKSYEGLLQAVQDETITEERLDESLYRIFRVKYRSNVMLTLDGDNAMD